MANRAYADRLLARIARVPGVADARIQQEFNEPTLRVDVNRQLASLVGITEKDAATSMLDTPGRQHTDRAHVLAEPA